MLLREIFNKQFLTTKSDEQPEYDDSTVHIKAGIIPYIRSIGGKVEFLFMVSSDPKFGGPDPMISKGGVDPSETTQQTAKREGIEELGLKLSNMKSSLRLISDNTTKGLDNSYRMIIYACEVKSKKDFGSYHYETAYTKWMTNDQFQQTGRKEHRKIVQKAFNIVGSLK